MSGELPALVTYGGWIAPLVLVVLVSLVVVLIRATARLVWRRNARQEVRTCEAKRTSLREGDVVLQGVVRGAPVVTPSEPENEARIELQPGTNWLEVDGMKVDLSGTIRVRRGSAANDESVRVVDGDAVFIAGTATLRREIRDDAASLWQLSGDLDLVALRPAIPVLGRSLTILAAIVVGAISFLGLSAYGKSLAERGTKRSDGSFSGPIDSLHPLAIAAALPGARSKALDELDHYFLVRAGRSERALAQRVALARTQEGCWYAAYTLLEVGALEAALDETRACKDSKYRAEALLLLGRYGEAARDASFPKATLTQQLHIHIALRQWMDAAQSLESRLTSFKDAEFAARMRCLVGLFRHYGGGTTAIADTNSTCDLVKALVPVFDREKALDVARTWSSGDRVEPHFGSSSLALIAWAHGVPARVDGFRSATYSLTSSADTKPAWFVPHASPAADPAQVHAWLAVRQVLAGTFDKAREEASRYVSVVDPTDERRNHDAPALVRAVQLRAGDSKIESSSHHRLDELIAIRAGVVDLRPDYDIVAEPCGRDTRAAMRAAADGEALPLIDVLEDCRMSIAAASMLQAVGPRVQKHRRELARAAMLAVERVEFMHDLDEVVRELALHRDLQRSLGATEEVAHLQGIIDRHLNAFSSREQVTALVLLEDLLHL